MRITTIGTGYVGLVTGTVFSDRGNKVIGVDNNPKVVEMLKQGRVHIFEPGLEKMVKKNLDNGNLSFSTDLESAVKESEVIFLGVGTPSSENNGSFNTTYLEKATEQVAKALDDNTYRVIVGKSTVPQGTGRKLIEVIKNNTSATNWSYASNPETLAEGTAVSDFEKPSRIILGSDDEKALDKLTELYRPFSQHHDKIMTGKIESAELAKLAANAALASRVAFINEVARIADASGADMAEVRKMICEDPRIGYSFMFPGPGYGGSCFPKDVQGLVHQAEIDGVNVPLLSKVHESNETHKAYAGGKIAEFLIRKPSNIAVWGLTFKPNTDDMRDSASIPIISRLINEGNNVTAYDPQDKKAREIFADKIRFANNPYDAVKNADGLVLLTEWKEFDSPDFNKLRESMRGREIFDMRNRWSPKVANREGFDYYGVGRNFPINK